MDDTPEYKVGKGKPPEDYQFKRGQSGNPSGRPKRKPSIAECLGKELDQIVMINEGGKTKRISKRHFIAKTAVRKAMKGEARMVLWVEQMDANLHPKETMPQKIRVTMKMED